MTKTQDFSIVSASLTIEAMRDSGYKNTDQALAELIDNSVEAESSLIEVAAVEATTQTDHGRTRSKISEIAVADNGIGMTKSILRRALRFGDGTRLDRRARGIGRFGVGLPQASISQCQRVDIWTWRHGADNAHHCYLDLDEIKIEGVSDVPRPEVQAVPERWRGIFNNTAEKSGTLVVWSRLDRTKWVGGAKTLEHTAGLCGRIYRKFLRNKNKPLEIILIKALDENGDLVKSFSRECLPNDPLYLMSDTTTPEPFNKKPMFRIFNEHSWTIKVNDQKGKVRARCSLARPEAINSKIGNWPHDYNNPGDAPWGKHANHNNGVSIVRAGRELEMSDNWVNNYDPTERWWSAEVEFDPVLDEIFGVVNNKQHAHAFVEGAAFDYREDQLPEESYQEYLDRLQETGDFKHHLIDIWVWLDNQIRQMRSERGKIVTGARKSASHPLTKVTIDDVGTNIINEQRKKGETGDSDMAPKISKQAKTDVLKEFFIREYPDSIDETTASIWAREVVENGRRVMLKSVNLGHEHAFFDIKSVSDVIQILINSQHPAHKHLFEILGDSDEEETSDEYQARLRHADFTLRMLLIAWARYEDKVPQNIKNTLRDTRMDWGREARNFLG